MFDVRSLGQGLLENAGNVSLSKLWLFDRDDGSENSIDNSSLGFPGESGKEKLGSVRPEESPKALVPPVKHSLDNKGVEVL